MIPLRNFKIEVLGGVFTVQIFQIDNSLYKAVVNGTCHEPKIAPPKIPGKPTQTLKIKQVGPWEIESDTEYGAIERAKDAIEKNTGETIIIAEEMG